MRYVFSFGFALAMSLALMAGCSDENGEGGSGGTAGSGGDGGSSGMAGTGGTAGTGGADTCASQEWRCTDAAVEPIEACCPRNVPDQEDACDGTESLVNPMTCTATGSVVTHKLTFMKLADSCNTGFNLDQCDGQSCIPGGLAAGEGEGGVDNALAGLGALAAGVGANLGRVNRAFSDAICGLTDDCLVEVQALALSVEVQTGEGCANVTIKNVGACRAAWAFAVGRGPESVFVADLNADTVPDLVTANFGSDDVSVLLGDGDGTFAAATAFATGRGPWSVFVADLNADTVPDLVTANAGSDDVSVLLGNGDGTFGAATAFPVGDTAVSVFVADLNADTVPDLVYANVGSDDVRVLLGNGDGTFRAASGAGNVDCTSSAIVNLSTPTEAGTVCASGALGAVPMTVLGIPLVFGNVVIRATLSQQSGFTGLLGATLDEDTTANITGIMLDIPWAPALFDISEDLTQDTDAYCNAMSAAFVVGGVTAEAP